MTVVSIGVSEDVMSRLAWPEKSLAERLKHALRASIKLGLSPELHMPAGDASITASVALSGSDEQRLRALPLDKKACTDLGNVASGCIAALSKHQVANVKGASGEVWIDGPRNEQPKMCRLMADSHGCEEILFLEASTGVGKGRAVVAHAAYLIKRDLAERVLVTAPTIEVLGQLFSEYKTLKHGVPTAASMIGLGEFVSEVGLRDVLEGESADELPDVKAARAWLKRGSKKPWGNLQKQWLCDSLEAAAPNFPIALVKLNHYQKMLLNEEEDGGLRAYGKCGRDAKTSRIVFCTHTMLALDIVQRLYNSRDDGIDYSERTQWESNEAWWHADLEQRAKCGREGIIPKYDTVLVDEAHLLEQSFDRATSDQISIFALKNLLIEHGNPALRTAGKRAFKKLTSLGKQETSVRIGEGDVRRTSDQTATDCMRSLVKSIARNEKLVKNKAARAALREFRRKFRWLEKDKPTASYFSTRMFFSPSRGYPLVERTKRNVNRELSFLWKVAKSGVLASATLYLHTATGYAMHDMRKELRVPPTRARAMRPICPNWVTDPATVYLPPAMPGEDALSGLLVPPKQAATDEERALYFDRIANFLAHEWPRRTRGGTLVLMTSFDAIDQVSRRLMDGPIGRRILTSERKESFAKRRRQYMKAVESGQAPIWFATGRAWTGLDLSTGKRAIDDHAIDYLVVPRLPILINCSASHRERVFGADGKGQFGNREVWQCARHLRQGVGRAVRRRGVPDKEIFVLDGRLSWAVGGPFCTLRGMFSEYEKQKTLLMADADKLVRYEVS